jgi:NitT/TauT family transport system permease protein
MSRPAETTGTSGGEAAAPGPAALAPPPGGPDLPDAALVTIRRPRPGPPPPVLRRTAMAVVALLVVLAGWQLYKSTGPETGVELFGTRVLPRTDDRSMPSVPDILQRFADPVNRADDRAVGVVVAEAGWYTLRVAMVGFAAGVVVGMALALAMCRSRWAERGLMPFVIVSQTVPLVALAPLVVGWAGRAHIGPWAWEPWMSVAAIASYLAFFPVAIGALRGLQSPPAHAVELMRAIAASWWQTTRLLRLPASVPYLVPALRLGAASAVVGAIVAEISTGRRGGIGRLVIEYSREATGDPAKVYVAIAGAAALGLVVALGVAGFGSLLTRNRAPEVR